MGDLGTSLTWSEGIKLFQDGLYKVIKTKGKKKASHEELKLVITDISLFSLFSLKISITVFIPSLMA